MDKFTELLKAASLARIDYYMEKKKKYIIYNYPKVSRLEKY